MSAARRLVQSLLVGSALIGARAGAQAIVTSPAPNDVDVTIYRDPGRPASARLDLRWLNGFALISETRQVSIPAGESDVRFEGVAGGIIPQSAIVTGFPEGIVERNRDAYLLSPATILDRSLGRRVHLRRTSPATGRVREQEAIVRTGAGGAVVIQTADGFEALRCTGLPEMIVYDQVPPGLSARPTLSVRTRSRQPVTATVTLSYLATGLDWQANYVANLSPDGDRIDLFAWLTIANGDETSFIAADTQAVAGRLNRTYVRPQPSEGGPLQLRCWPQGRTSDLDNEQFERIVVTGSRIAADFRSEAPPPPPPPPSPPPPPAMEAVQEELGDLKLYRIPEPVTVAARSQKQVAFLVRPSVQVRTVYRRRVGPDEGDAFLPAQWVLVTRNRPAEGLGLPLPAGRLVLFREAAGRPILVGEGTMTDRAVGEDVEIELGPAPGVTSRLRRIAEREKGSELELMVTNDLSRPVPFEAEFEGAPNLVRSRTRLERRDGRALWRVTVPANGTATLRYRYRSPN